MSQYSQIKRELEKPPFFTIIIQSSKATKLNDLVKVLEDANHEVSMSLLGNMQIADYAPKLRSLLVSQEPKETANQQ